MTAPSEWGKPRLVEAPEPPTIRTSPLRRRLEALVAFGGCMVVAAVTVLCWTAWGAPYGVGWGLAVAGVLTVAFALGIVDVPTDAVYTGSPDGEG
jgi:hypothetical protein